MRPGPTAIAPGTEAGSVSAVKASATEFEYPKEVRAGMAPCRETEQEERRRQLREFLAAKGKLRQQPPRPAGGGGRSCLKDEINPWKTNLPKADPRVARKCVAPAVPSKGQPRMPSAPKPGAHQPHAKALATSSQLPGRKKRSLGSPVPAGVPQEGPGSRRVGSKFPKAMSRAVGAAELSCSWTHRCQVEREGQKENRVDAAVPPRANKRGTVHVASQRGPPLEKIHRRAIRTFGPGSSHTQIKRPAEAPAQGRPRDLPGTCWGASLAQPPFSTGGSSAVSRPGTKCQGPIPKVEKPSRLVLLPPRVDHKAHRAGHRKAPLPETKRCRIERAAEKRKAPQGTPQEGRLGVWGGLGRKKSLGQSRQSEKKAWPVTKTPGARARPTAATDHHHPLPAEEGAWAEMRQLPTGRPLTPSPQDRKKRLAEWLASQGKRYKRPPMTLPPAQKAKQTPKEKASLNLSFWRQLEEEKDEAGQCPTLAGEIGNTLTSCLRLAEEGVPSAELLATLSRIPEATRFAQFWLCKAKLLAREGPFDVAGLCQAAVGAGAVPREGLLDGIAEISRDAQKMLLAGPTSASPPSGQAEGRMRGLVSHPFSTIKLQVTPLFRASEGSARLDVALLTPVRRSRRIEQVSTGYPEMLKDHHWVVSSLDEISASRSRKSQFVFRKNKALTEEADLAGLAMGGPFSLGEG